jgi:hypothetical protein
LGTLGALEPAKQSKMAKKSSNTDRLGVCRGQGRGLKLVM